MLFKSKNKKNIPQIKLDDESFNKKTVVLESEIGYIIKNARVKKNMTIEDVAEKLNLREDYISIIEEGEGLSLDKKICLSGYLINLCEFLELQDSGIIKDYKDYITSLEYLATRNIED